MLTRWGRRSKNTLTCWFKEFYYIKYNLGGQHYSINTSTTFILKQGAEPCVRQCIHYRVKGTRQRSLPHAQNRVSRRQSFTSGPILLTSCLHPLWSQKRTEEIPESSTSIIQWSSVCKETQCSVALCAGRLLYGNLLWRWGTREVCFFFFFFSKEPFEACQKCTWMHTLRLEYTVIVPSQTEKKQWIIPQLWPSSLSQTAFVLIWLIWQLRLLWLCQWGVTDTAVWDLMFSIMQPSPGSFHHSGTITYRFSCSNKLYKLEAHWKAQLCSFKLWILYRMHQFYK